jgi:hypothetical protein
VPLKYFAIGLKRKRKVGGADGIRTHDLLDAIEARSQLRHGPTEGLQFTTFASILNFAFDHNQALFNCGAGSKNLKNVAFAKIVTSDATNVAL